MDKLSQKYPKSTLAQEYHQHRQGRLRKKNFFFVGGLVSGLVVVIMLIMSKYLHLYYDEQPTTSIINSRNYIVTSWKRQPATQGYLSEYAIAYSKLTPEQQAQLRRLSRSYANTEQQLLKVNYYYIQERVQSQQLPTDQENFPTGNARNMSNYAIYVFTNDKLLPALAPQQQLVKYLVGYPNDIVELTLTGLYVNGIYLRELPAVISQRLRQHPLQLRRIVVPQGHYWVYGDYPASIDSMYFGVVPEQSLHSRVLVKW